MKYYYYLGNQRYVSDKLNLDQCKNVMFKLEMVDEDGVGLGIFNIVKGGELVRESSNNCTDDQIKICKACPTTKNVCVAASQCLASASCTPFKDNPRYCFCPPPKPTPPPSPPAPTPKPCSDSSRIDKNTCEHDNLTTYSYIEHLFSAASASGDPVPSPTPGPSSSQCKWDGSSCCSLDEYNVNQKCPPKPKLPDKVFIGYWGAAQGQPDCGINEQIPTALNKGYNIISVAFLGFINPATNAPSTDGHIYLKTNCSSDQILNKKQLHAKTNKQLDINDWFYTLSLGGENSAWPSQTVSEEIFANNFVTDFENLARNYGFQGYDIDVENFTGDMPVVNKALRTLFLINKILYNKGYLVTMAPQPADIYPVCGTIPNGQNSYQNPWNLYVPLIDSEGIKYVSLVAIQIYNNQKDALQKKNFLPNYAQGLQQDDCILAPTDNKLPFGTGKINIPPDKLVFGFPAAPKAANSGETLPGIMEDPKNLVKIYKEAPGNYLIKNTRGLMTWSIGWDANNSWKWIDAVSSIFK